MSIVLWVFQIILALLFVAAGSGKVLQPIEKLEPRMPWISKLPVPLIRFIGVAEIAGALGLVIPALTGIAPILTPIAATALASVMLLASIVHTRFKEFPQAGVNLVLMIALAFLAWGRFGPFPL